MSLTSVPSGSTTSSPRTAAARSGVTSRCRAGTAAAPIYPASSPPRAARRAVRGPGARARRPRSARRPRGRAGPSACELEGIVEELSGQIELETLRHPSSCDHSPETHGDGDRSLSLRPGTSAGLAVCRRSCSPGWFGSKQGTRGCSCRGRGRAQQPAPPHGELLRSPPELNRASSSARAEREGV